MAETNDLDTLLIGGDSSAQTTNGTGGASTQTEIPLADAGESKVEADDRASEGEVDYKAKFEAADKELAKTKNDLKSIEGGNKASAARDAKLDALQVSIEGLQKSQDAQEKGQRALVKALNSGETEGLSAELDTITQDSHTQREMARLKVRGQSMLESLKAVGKKGDTVVVDIEHDPRFADVVANWNSISGDAGLTASEVLAELSTVIVQASLKMSDIKDDARDKVVEETRTAGKRALEETGVLDTDTGGRMGPSFGSVVPLLQRYGRGERVTKAEQAQIDEHLDDQLDDTPGSIFSAR